MSGEYSHEVLAIRSPARIAWDRLKANKVAFFSGFVALFFVISAFAAPLITRLMGLSQTAQYSSKIADTGIPFGSFGGMSLTHPLGLEPGVGRDLMSLLLYGSRISFTVAIITSFFSIGIGMIVGIAAGFYGGRVDAVIGRISDFILSFPSTFMIVALSIPLTQRIEATKIARDNGARIIVLIIFFVIFGWPAFARLVRSQVLSMRERDFVMAAQSQGASGYRVIIKELLPNLWPTAIVFLSLSLPGFLAAEAVFSFLGVGVQAPASTWGLVLSDSVSYWQQDPAYLLIPSIMLIVVVLALNLFGDGLRDALDPKSDRG